MAQNLKENIQKTIGVPFEVIVIENGKGEMGLCEVYNLGAQKARYDILCYSHEDIEIQTTDWGNKVVELFSEHKELGLLGVAGSGYKPLSPSGWWYENANKTAFFENYIQSDKSSNKAVPVYRNPLNEKLSYVACIDGCWFCTRRQIALELKFDDHLFNGFHCYDIDYSLSVFQQYKVAVSFEILIKHYSEGHLNKEWLTDTLKLHKKWKNVLPISTLNFSKQLTKQEEIVAFEYFMKLMLGYPSTLKPVLSLLWSPKIRYSIGFRKFIKLNSKVLLHVWSKYKNRLLNSSSINNQS